MGSAIARNLGGTDLDLVVYNRTTSKARPFEELGAEVALSPREAAAEADVVISNLLDDESVYDCLLGEEGLLAGMRDGAVHVGTTTISPAAADDYGRLHAEAGSAYVAGPVVGRPDTAEAGELLTFLAGEERAVDRARPVVEAYTSEIITVGETYAHANTIKLAINYFAISMVELMGQLYALSDKSGVGVERMREIIPMLLQRSVFVKYSQKIADREFEPAGFEMSSGMKDVQLMLDEARRVGAPLKFGRVISDKMITGLAHGTGALDWSAVYEVSRWEAGLDSRLE